MSILGGIFSALAIGVIVASYLDAFDPDMKGMTWKWDESDDDAVEGASDETEDGKGNGDGENTGC